MNVVIKKKQIDNEKNKNEIYLQGTVVSEPILDHEVNGKKFYIFNILINRENNKDFDTLPLYCDEDFLQFVKAEQRLSVVGKLVVKIINDGKKKTEITKVKVLGLADFNGNKRDINEFIFEGYVFRKYPKRNIASNGHKVIDLKIMTKFLESKNIFSCNAWGKLADELESISLQDFVSGKGRLQAREFVKNKEDGSKEIKTIYEVCLRSLDKK